MIGFTSINLVLISLAALHLGAISVSILFFALALLLAAAAFGAGPHEDRRAERAERIETLIHEKSRQITRESSS